MYENEAKTSINFNSRTTYATTELLYYHQFYKSDAQSSVQLLK